MPTVRFSSVERSLLVVSDENGVRSPDAIAENMLIIRKDARFCSLSLSEYLRRLGLGKEVKAAITERDYRLFRMLNGLKAELPQLQKEEILSRLEAILNELK